jgi:hypothetical protein
VAIGSSEGFQVSIVYGAVNRSRISDGAALEQQKKNECTGGLDYSRKKARTDADERQHAIIITIIILI